MKLAVYARVSGRAQALKGTSIKDQIKACRAWAKDHDHRIVSIYEDAGISGVLLDRPELARMLLDARGRRFEGVLVFDLDRLARDLVVQETVIGELKSAGVELYSVQQPNLETGDPWRVFARQIFGASAQLHKAMTVLRLKAGRRAAKERKGYCEGQARYGFKRSDGSIRPDTSEQTGADLIRRLRNTRPPTSYREICAELERRGIRPRRGQRWHPEAVRRIYRYGNKPH